MKVLALAVFVLGITLGLVASFVFYAAFSEYSARMCWSGGGCTDVFSILVISACAIVAACVMMFAGFVLVRR